MMATLLTPWTETLLAVFILAAGLTLGALIALALGRLLDEAWLAPLHPALSAMAHATPVLVPIALPLLLAVPALYGWGALPDVGVWHEPAVFTGRGVALVVLWAWLGRVLTRPRAAGRTAGAALLALVLTGAIAMEDWALSGDQAWTGSLQGLSLLVEQVGAALALATLIALRHAMPNEAARNGLERALLTLAMATLWLWFVQYIVVYAADLPPEAAWYLRRSVGGWGWVKAGIALPALLLAIGLALVPQWRAWRLVVVSVLMLAQHVAHLLWVLRPDGAAPVAAAALVPMLVLLGLVLACPRQARPA